MAFVKGLAATTAAVALTASLGLASIGSAMAAEEAPQAPEAAASVDSIQNRIDAKLVIMGACNLFASMDLGLTDADSPAVIAQSDPKFAEFFEKLATYRLCKDVTFSDVTFECSIVAVEAATARGSETNYRFTVEKATMMVNGSASVNYVRGEGLVVE